MARFVVAVVALFALLHTVVATAVSSYPWNSITVGGNVTFSYIDSGKPSGNQYLTVVVLHGDGFNSLVFTRMLQKANDFGWRVIAVNRRDYAPTTLFTPAELAPLSAGFNGQMSFFRQRGIETGLLLEALINKLSLPPAQGAIKNHQFGMVLVGWSLGCVTTHSFLANLDGIPASTLNTISKYLHTVIQHDPAASQMAWPVPPEHDLSLWYNPDIHQTYALFSQWARSYFQHNTTDPKTGKITDLDFNNPVASPPATFTGLATSVVNPMTDFNAFSTSELTQLFLPLNVTAQLTRLACWDKKMASYLPQVRVRYYSGAQTPGLLMYTNWMVQATIANPSSIGGVRARDVGFWVSPKGNHFVFWEDADWTIGEFIKTIAVSGVGAS